VSLRRIRESLEASDGRQGGLAERLRNTVGGAEAVDALGTYADRLLVHRSSGTETSVHTVRQMVDQTRASTGKSPLVVIDYLQKVFVPGGSELEEERVTKIVEGLKDLALEIEVPVLAIVAADKEGLIAGRRLRVHNLRGSSALAYEADIVLIMNDKYDVVARHHLVYDVGNAERFRNWVIVTIEKNRSSSSNGGSSRRARTRSDCTWGTGATRRCRQLASGAPCSCSRAMSLSSTMAPLWACAICCTSHESACSS